MKLRPVAVEERVADYTAIADFSGLHKDLFTGQKTPRPHADPARVPSDPARPPFFLCRHPVPFNGRNAKGFPCRLEGGGMANAWLTNLIRVGAGLSSPVPQRALLCTTNSGVCLLKQACVDAA